MASPERTADLPESERYELSDLMFMATYGTPREELIQLGWQRQQELWA